MGYLLIPAVLFGGMAFLFGTLMVLALFLKSLGQAIRGKWRLAARFMVLVFLSLCVLAVCYYMFASQPVEWPWAPSHIPVYLLANVAFIVMYRLQSKWTNAQF